MTKKDILFSLIFIVLFGFVIVFALKRKHGLEKTHEVGIGVPYSYTANGRGNAGGLDIDFSYEIRGKQYKSTLAISTAELSTYNCNNYFIGASFPIVYSPTNPSNSFLLIRPKDFLRFEIPFPDSLSWVQKYVHDN